MDFSRVKNDFLKSGPGKVISGRAVLSRMEGEFTQQSQVCGNHLVFVGTDGDSEWGNRSTRFLRPLHAGEVLSIKFTVSGKDDIDEEFGRIAVDYEGTNQKGELVVLSKKNIYRIKKKPPRG